MPHFHKNFRPFTEAREFARSLGLKNQAEWVAFLAGKLNGKGGRPPDIPSAPNQAYAGKGWAGFADWLGTANMCPSQRTFLPFADARKFARGLGLKNRAEWLAFAAGKMPRKGRLPRNVPITPNEVYAGKGWEGFGDWLGTGNLCPRFRKFLTFTEARSFARKLGLKSTAEWVAYSAGKMPEKGRRPPDIPGNPSQVYAGTGWIGFADWLGTGKPPKNSIVFRPFAQARAFARRLGLKSAAEWQAFAAGKLHAKGQRPPDVPSNPNIFYAGEGWASYGDWIGKGPAFKNSGNFRPFAKARAFARNLKLKTVADWRAFCRDEMPHLGTLPPDIPKAPWHAYRASGWASIGDWLGTGKAPVRRGCFLPFADAREFARSLNLKTGRQWHAYCRGELPHLPPLPHGIPPNPENTYRGKGWSGMGGWLGTGKPCCKYDDCRPFPEARAFVQSLKLKNNREWQAYCRGELPRLGTRPPDIPSAPHTAYEGHGWRGYGDWIGTGTVAQKNRVYRPFREARAFVRKLGLKNQAEWIACCVNKLPGKPPLPADIPHGPHKYYAGKGWSGYADWLRP